MILRWSHTLTDTQKIILMYYKIPLYIPIGNISGKFLVLISSGVLISVTLSVISINTIINLNRSVGELNFKVNHLEKELSLISKSLNSADKVTQTDNSTITLISCCEDSSCIYDQSEQNLITPETPTHYKATTDISSRLIKNATIR